jgi:hypothetical protein
MMAKWAIKDDFWGRVHSADRRRFAEDERLSKEAEILFGTKRSLRDHAYHPDDLVFPFPDDCPCERCEHNRNMRR